MPAMIEYLLHLVALLRATVRDRGGLVAENVLPRQQLAVRARPTRRCPRLRARDKLFWVLARLARRDWRRHVVLVTPGTAVHWHRRGRRLFWRWRSRTRLGRPRVRAEVRELIAAMARDNPRWGAERIQGELLELGIGISTRTIQKYVRGARPPRRTGQSWASF